MQWERGGRYRVSSGEDGEDRRARCVGFQRWGKVVLVWGIKKKGEGSVDRTKVVRSNRQEKGGGVGGGGGGGGWGGGGGGGGGGGNRVRVEGDNKRAGGRLGCRRSGFP